VIGFARSGLRMTRRAAATTACAGVLLCSISSLAPESRAAQLSVSIANLRYQPASIVAMVGDTVTWSNEGIIPHTVTSTTGLFDSGHIQGGKRFSMTFANPGTFDYTCTIHPRMHGEVIVHAAGMQGMAMPPPATEPATPPQGAGVTVRLSKRRESHRTLTAISISAPRPGARVLLELYSREHFSWREVAHTLLNSVGEATLSLSPRVHLALRAVVVGAAGQAALISPIVHS
jgi:plastocyanin